MKIESFFKTGSIQPGTLKLGNNTSLSYRDGRTVLSVGGDDKVCLSKSGNAVQLNVNDQQQIHLMPQEARTLVVRGHGTNVTVDPDIAETMGVGTSADLSPQGNGVSILGKLTRPTAPPSDKSLHHLLLEHSPAPPPAMRRMEELLQPMAAKLGLPETPLPGTPRELTSFMSQLNTHLSEATTGTKASLIDGLLMSGSGEGGRLETRSAGDVGGDQKTLINAVLSFCPPEVPKNFKEF